MRIFDGQPVCLNIPIALSGNSIGVRNGGRLALNMRRVFIESQQDYLPESIEIDITELRIGQSVRISDLSMDNVTFLGNQEDVVVAVKTARAALVEEETEDASAEEGGGSGDETSSAEGGKPAGDQEAKKE